MVQAIMETLFDIVYLTTVNTLGIIMIVKGKSNKQYLFFGIMAVTLGAGDSFHLVPHAIALRTTELDNYVIALGIEKLITSITMTFFYILLYYVCRIRYQIKGQHYYTISMYVLSAIRIILCCFPQNGWKESNPSLSWGIYRNIPFLLIGILIIYLFARNAYKTKDKPFRFMWLTIVLSFGFYIPVVLWADVSVFIGMLMIPKTLAYVWTFVIGFVDMLNYLNKKISYENSIGTKTKIEILDSISENENK